MRQSSNTSSAVSDERQPCLSSARLDREAGRALLDHEHRDLLRGPRVGRGLRRDEINVGMHAVGDEHLRAVEHVMVAVAPRAWCGCAFTSEPASGSVTATAVMARPATISGIQRAFCAARAGIRHVHRGHVGVHQDGDRGAREGRAAELLGEHDRAERVHLGAAVFGRIADAEKAKLAHAAQHLARDVALLLPLQAVRLDLGLDEAADLRAQQRRALRGSRARGGRRIRGGSWSLSFSCSVLRCAPSP